MKRARASLVTANNTRYLGMFPLLAQGATRTWPMVSRGGMCSLYPTPTVKLLGPRGASPAAVSRRGAPRGCHRLHLGRSRGSPLPPRADLRQAALVGHRRLCPHLTLA